MALINCPECSHRISDQSISCPKCGFANSEANIAQKKIGINPPKQKVSFLNEFLLTFLKAVTFLVIIIGFFVYIAVTSV